MYVCMYVMYICIYITVILRFTSPRLTLFRFTLSNFLFPPASISVVIRFTSPFLFRINCDVKLGIIVNSYNFSKLLVKNILPCNMPFRFTLTFLESFSTLNEVLLYHFACYYYCILLIIVSIIM